MTQYPIRPNSAYAQLVKAGWYINAPAQPAGQNASVLTMLKSGYELTTPDRKWIMRKIAGVISLWQLEREENFTFALSVDGLGKAIEEINKPF